MTTDFDMIEFISSKICHDLAGPIGAINNAVEFLRDGGNEAIKSQAINLMEASSKEAVSRLQFYRIALGKGSTIGESNLGMLRELSQNFLSSTKVELDWPDHFAESSTCHLSNQQGKILLNIIWIASASLIKGGKLSISMNKSSSITNIYAKGAGKMVKLEDDQIALMQNKHDGIEISSRNVQLLLIGRMLKQNGCKLNIERRDETISFHIECKN